MEKYKNNKRKSDRDNTYSDKKNTRQNSRFDDKRSHTKNFDNKPRNDYGRTEKKEFGNENKDERVVHSFEQQRDDLVIGRNAVREALKSGRPCEYMLITKGENNGSVGELIAMCNERKIPIKQADSKKLDFMCGHSAHQGVILVSSAKQYCTVDDILQCARDRNEKPFIIICDSIEDPHNLGAIIRSAECCGAHGVIVPERRSVGLTYTVGKSSAGALEYMLVARVTNLNDCIRRLKDEGLWIFCADMDGTDYNEVDFDVPIAIVVGGEGNGVSSLVKKNCDTVVSIPMKGKINSLNASVAASLLMFKARGKM